MSNFAYNPNLATSPLWYSRQPHQRGQWLRQLQELIAFPTISANPKQQPAMQGAAVWLKQHLNRIGLQNAQVLGGVNGGAPSVYADWLHAPHQPTVLLYGHYDVQPVDPIKEWRTPPFQPTIVGQNLFGRGSSDDKGQFFIHLKAIESYLQTNGNLPLNLKVWLEGEEEIDSPNLSAFLQREASRLRADAMLVSDTAMLSPKRPSIIYGLRGNLSFELEVIGPSHDLHAGRFGGAVHNPLQAMCEIIAGLHNQNGQVTIPGFYDKVHELEPTERQELTCCAPSDNTILHDLALPRGWGEKGYTLFERMTIRPALTINGLWGGYTGPGAKSVIPRHALARLQFRLVPQQEPLEVARLLQHYLQQLTPPTMAARLKFRGGIPPVLVTRRHPAMSAAARAVYQVWGVPPVFTRSGGTIALVSAVHRQFDMPVVLLGFGLPDDNVHAPNEKMHLPNFFSGVETIIRFFQEYAR